MYQKENIFPSDTVFYRIFNWKFNEAVQEAGELEDDFDLRNK